MSEPVWIRKAALVQAHALALAEHGGLEGIRDEGLLDSALARPKNLYAYEGVEDVRRLAASMRLGFCETIHSVMVISALLLSH